MRVEKDRMGLRQVKVTFVGVLTDAVAAAKGGDYLVKEWDHTQKTTEVHNLCVMLIK